MTRLLLATNNAHKVTELRAILADLACEFLTLGQAGIRYEVEETGATYRENAVLKATTYARLSGLLTLADDSGLEVDALGGAPGIISARYAGEGATSEQRIEKLLAALTGVPDASRSARFVCVIAVGEPGGRTSVFHGSCEGVITLAPSGEGGFGYDPVFYMPEHGCTMAELPEDVKNRVSHRALACRLALPLLRSACAAESPVGPAAAIGPQ